MSIPEGWALVVPETREQLAATARALLAVAASPADVRTQRGGTEFLVPEAVAERYRKSVNRPRRARGKGTNG